MSFLINTQDTIAAIATPSGKGGVGIIRISGLKAKQIAEQILGKCPPPRLASYLPFKDNNNEIIDIGIAIFFPNPHSFTGEDVIELQGHGGPVILDLLLQNVLQLGARLAEPGEFSQRAFLNDKIDLAQAEAIADLIDSSSVAAAKGAIRSLQGEFSKKINTWVDALIHLRMYVEAAIDFPEEEVDFLNDGKIAKALIDLTNTLQEILAAAKQGSILREGIHLVIAGKPNAGKSSLLNQLCGKEVAIVTEIAGTTRDVLKEYININGIPLHVFDTAGLRETTDRVEQEGVKRAKAHIEQADLVLLVIDGQEQKSRNFQELLQDQPELIPYADKVIIVINKIDLQQQDPSLCHDSGDLVCLSARTGKGLPLLKSLLLQRMGVKTEVEGSFIARRRHLEILNFVENCLAKAQAQFLASGAGELLAEDLRLMQEQMGNITGQFTADDLLGKIFSSFCIGK